MAIPRLKNLDQASVLITGGSSGIGLGAALAFARAGVPRIALNGRDAARGEQARQAVLAQAPRAQVLFIAADVSSAEGAVAVTEAVQHAFGAIDALVTCAGGDHAPELFHNIPIARVDSILQHYMMTTLNVVRAALPGMMDQGGGVIINVASDAGKVPTPGTCVNGAAMAGLMMFSRTLALEAKRSGIRVHAVTPSIVGETRTFDHVMATGFSQKLFRKAIDAAALGLVTPEDIAPLIVFLASPAASRMTGQVISVNGGVST